MKKNTRLFIVLILFLIALIFPVAGTNYMRDLYIQTLLFAYLALAWNILTGFAGQFSFGNALFYGIGGYTSSILFINFGLSPWIGMLLGAVLSGIIAALQGYLFFRFNLRGAYFALGTLAFSHVFLILAGNIKITGGNVGLLLPLSNSFVDYQFNSRLPYAYIILSMVVILVLVTTWIRRSSLYYKFIAIQQNEQSAEALGINPFKYKMIAIILSGMFTALGGTFYAQWQLLIEPPLMFGDTISVDILLPAIIGGVGTVFGPIIGSVALTVISEVSRVLFGEIAGMNTFIYGLLLVIVIVFYPKGLIGLFDKFNKNRKKRTGDNSGLKGAS